MMVGERGVRGMEDDAVEEGDTSSEGTGFRLELRLGRGGVLASDRTPNSDMGSESRDATVKLLPGSSEVNAGSVGDGVSPLPAVCARRGGGRDGGGLSRRGVECATAE